MEEETDSREALEKKKAELLEKLKEADRRYKYKMYEGKALREMLEKKRNETNLPPAREIKKRINRLEFLISTEARTLQQERELVKEVKEWERKLKEAVEIERMGRRLRFIEEDMRKAGEQVAELERKVNEIRNALKEKMKERRKTAKESKLLELKRKVEEERKKEVEPFLQKESDGKVDLGEICVIKKKDK
jgi:predicted  nucleic acid-binding Zn-ribbon protein